MPKLSHRLAVAVAVALCAAGISYIKVRALGYATDFAWFWSGGRALIEGQNPYLVIQPGGPFHFDAGFMYPLTAAVAVVPLAAMPILPASVLFAAVGAGALAFAMTRDGWWRLPALMSFPMLWCVSAGQWAPLVAAAVLMPTFAWAAACKPTLGSAAFLARPSWRFVWIGGGFTVLTLLIDPTWPADWIHATQARPGGAGAYHIPLLAPGGVLLLAAALRWRTMEGRLLLGMALVPQAMLVYDQVALGLLARTRLQTIVFALWSYLIAGAAIFAPPALDKAHTLDFLATVTVWLYYLPALLWVLRYRNEGAVPAALERLTARFPRWLRGAPA